MPSSGPPPAAFFPLFFDTRLLDFFLWPIDYSPRPLSFFCGASFSFFKGAFDAVVCRLLSETLGLPTLLRDFFREAPAFWWWALDAGA